MFQALMCCRAPNLAGEDMQMNEELDLKKEKTDSTAAELVETRRLNGAPMEDNGDYREPTKPVEEVPFVEVEGAKAEECAAGGEPVKPPPEPEKPARRQAGEPAVFVVIVNPKSGGNVAGEFLRIAQGGHRVDEPDGVKAVVFSYAITDPGKAGFEHLAREVDLVPEGERARCIVAGGDGTVMWTIEEIFKAGIPVDRVSLGTVPFGTGNDFANVTGWGTKGPPRGFLKEQQGFRGLASYVRRWLRSETKPYDIWEVSVQTQKNGSFRFIEDGKKVCTDGHVKRHHIKELPDGGLEMSKYMCNYFSFGLDARIGIGFDKNRQGTQVANKAVYGWEGTKKLLFKKKGLIANILESMRIVDGSSPMDKAADGHDPDAFPAGDAVFTTAEETGSDGRRSARLLGNPVTLIFLNIPSIAGGLNIWNWSSRKMGTTAAPDLLGARQDFADGKLECLSYRSGIGYVLEQVRAPPISGRGNRVYSGGGPLRLKFKSPADESFVKGTSHCKGRTYMQVDGEYFVVHEPDTIVVRHHCTIQVLVSCDPPSGCC